MCGGSSYGDVEVTNLTSAWEDGRAFLALLNDATPHDAPYRPVSDSVLNRKKAYRLAEELFGVPQLLNYQDARVFSYEQVLWGFTSTRMFRAQIETKQKTCTKQRRGTACFLTLQLRRSN